MNVPNLKQLREERGMTQKQAALRLELSQSYVSMLENAERKLNASLARRVVRALKAPPTWLRLPDPFQPTRHVDPDWLARQLGALGYPGYRYLAGKTRTQNPACVLLTALAADNLEPRAFEALPWLVLRYPDMACEWLASNAKLNDLQNRLGFAVALAKGLAEKRSAYSHLQTLKDLLALLEHSRLAREDTLGQESLRPAMRQWLKENRGEEAKFWNLLTGWKPEHLRYVA